VSLELKNVKTHGSVSQFVSRGAAFIDENLHCLIVIAHANGTKPEMFRSAQHDKDLSPNTMAGIFAAISTGLRDI
jgi:hypothetical protein